MLKPNIPETNPEKIRKRELVTEWMRGKTSTPVNWKLAHNYAEANMLNNKNKGDLNMMNVERILSNELREYEVADKITNPEMLNIITSLETRLAQVLSDYLYSWFMSSNTALSKMQMVVKAFKNRADDLVNEYKYKSPAESNRFVLELAEIQYKYAERVVSTSVVTNAMRECFNNEMKYLLAKKKVVEINKNMTEETNCKEIKKTCKKPEDKTKELLNEIKESFTKINNLIDVYLNE